MSQSLHTISYGCCCGSVQAKRFSVGSWRKSTHGKEGSGLSVHVAVPGGRAGRERLEGDHFLVRRGGCLQRQTPLQPHCRRLAGAETDPNMSSLRLHHANRSWLLHISGCLQSRVSHALVPSRQRQHDLLKVLCNGASRRWSRLRRRSASRATTPAAQELYFYSMEYDHTAMTRWSGLLAALRPRSRLGPSAGR